MGERRERPGGNLTRSGVLSALTQVGKQHHLAILELLRQDWEGRVHDFDPPFMKWPRLKLKTGSLPYRPVEGPQPTAIEVLHMSLLGHGEVYQSRHAPDQVHLVGMCAPF